MILIYTYTSDYYCDSQLPLVKSCSARFCLILSRALPAIGTSIASGDTCGNIFLRIKSHSEMVINTCMHAGRIYMPIPPTDKSIYFLSLCRIVEYIKKTGVKPLRISYLVGARKHAGGAKCKTDLAA
jgi:hypothetical protein